MSLVSGCVIVITLFSQYAQVHNITVAQALDQICDLFARDQRYERICKDIVIYVAPLITHL